MNIEPVLLILSAVAAVVGLAFALALLWCCLCIGAQSDERMEAIWRQMEEGGDGRDV
jgi:hypothetical protein